MAENLGFSAKSPTAKAFRMETKPILTKIAVRHFLSLRQVELPITPLTALVGPNASGKSNLLKALLLMNQMLVTNALPSAGWIQNRLWADGGQDLELEFETIISGRWVRYALVLRPDPESRIQRETLEIDGKPIISVRDGQGTVKEEETAGAKDIAYHSRNLALKSAGDYGSKPITNQLTRFIQQWRFYQFDPDWIRAEGSQVGDPLPDLEEVDSKGRGLQELLLHWHQNHPARFEAINQAFEKQVKLRMQPAGRTLRFLEGYAHPISLDKVSDGALRLLAYLVFAHQSRHPSLIVIEEPERSLHPDWLNVLSDILDQLSLKTQVLITTHSPKLLDTFPPERLVDHLGVLFLHRIPGQGTRAFPLDAIIRDKKGLETWIDEFGIGSAIFDSDMFPDILEEKEEEMAS